ncbi:MAG: FecR family protein [Bacteroidales bacterium]
MLKNKEYNKATLEELIHNQEFVRTLMDISSEDEWNELIEANKDNKSNIQQAKKFITLFLEDKADLDDERRHKLWLKIKQSQERQSGKRKLVLLWRSVGAVASVLVLVALAGAWHLNFRIQKTPKYTFTATVNADNQNLPVLTLASGKTIIIKEPESQVTVLDNKNALSVNDDTVYNAHGNVTTTDGAMMNEIFVPFGSKMTLTLSDGSRVWLNAGSRFAFPQKFKGENRKVFLDGEGYFEVAKNTKKPFIVSSQRIDVKVLGTKFNLSTYGTDNSSETVLLEGSVEISGASDGAKGKVKTVKIKANQKAVYNTTDNIIAVNEEHNAQDYMAWTKGWYKFSNEKLDQVLLRVGRFYNVSFRYDAEAIDKALPLSGKLDLQQNLEQVMYTLSQVTGISYEIKNNEILIN